MTAEGCLRRRAAHKSTRGGGRRERTRRRSQDGWATQRKADGPYATGEAHRAMRVRRTGRREMCRVTHVSRR